MVHVTPRPLPRRSALRLMLLGAAGMTLAGCEDGPSLPVPGRGGDRAATSAPPLPPDTDLLLAVRARVHERLGLLRMLEGKAGRAAQKRLESLWEEQLITLEEILTLGGVSLPALVTTESAAGTTSTPTESTAGTTSTPTQSTAGTTPTPTESTAGTVKGLGGKLRAEQDALVRSLTTSTAANRPMLVSLVAQHAWAADRLGAPVAWGPLAGPKGAAAVGLLATTRPAVYGLEVLAARSFAEERVRYENILTPLSSLNRQLTELGGEAAPVPPLGYDLPEDLSTEDARRELALTLVSDLAPAALVASPEVGTDPTQLTSIVRVVAEAAAWRSGLGAQAEPFPGLQD